MTRQLKYNQNIIVFPFSHEFYNTKESDKTVPDIKERC